MKIGILTYHWVFNHGANLQTVSTIGYMRKIGHDPVVINWIPRDLEQAYLNYTIQAQVECFRKFQEEYYPLTEFLLVQIHYLCYGKDVIVCDN